MDILVSQPVSKAGNSVKNNEPELLELADDGGAARGELTPPPWTE